MKRRWLPPKPEPPPEGYMYYYWDLVPIRIVEQVVKCRLGTPHPSMPTWRNDPTYNMRLTKRPTTTKEK